MTLPLLFYFEWQILVCYLSKNVSIILYLSLLELKHSTLKSSIVNTEK